MFSQKKNPGADACFISQGVMTPYCCVGPSIFDVWLSRTCHAGYIKGDLINYSFIGNLKKNWGERFTYIITMKIPRPYLGNANFQHEDEGTCKWNEFEVYWFIHTARQVQGKIAPGTMEPNMLYRNVQLVQHRERNQDKLFPVVLVLFPVPVPIPFLCSVNKSLDHAAGLQKYHDRNFQPLVGNQFNKHQSLFANYKK